MTATATRALPAGTDHPQRVRVRRWLLLAAWAGLCSAILAHPGGYSWHYFSDGALLLFGAHPHGLSAAGGLHLYADYPQFQIGPISFLLARALAPFGIHVAEAIMLGVGACVALELERLAQVATGQGTGALGRVTSRRRVFLGQLLLVPLWVELAVHFGHLDDVLALAFAVAAVSAAARGRYSWVGPLLGAAIAAKPWAAAFLPLLLVLPAPRRRRQLLWSLALPAMCWLPFAVADPATVTATGQFTIHNAADSALRALGVLDPRTPWWCRPAQLLTGLLVGAFAVRRGRWPAVLLAGIGARLLLDPGTYAYYTTGAVVAALVLDVLCPRSRWPLATATTVIGLYLPQLLHLPAAFSGQLRLAACLALLLLAVTGRAGHLTGRLRAAGTSRLAGAGQPGAGEQALARDPEVAGERAA